MGVRENIIRLRTLSTLTQEDFGKIAGVSRGAVSQWEGGFSEPRMGAIEKLARHFGIPKSWLIEDDGMALVIRDNSGRLLEKNPEDRITVYEDPAINEQISVMTRLFIQLNDDYRSMAIGYMQGLLSTQNQREL
jgi:transcriptional regulator with XRE-family HTH domain